MLRYNSAEGFNTYTAGYMKIINSKAIFTNISYDYNVFSGKIDSNNWRAPKKGDVDYKTALQSFNSLKPFMSAADAVKVPTGLDWGK